MTSISNNHYKKDIEITRKQLFNIGDKFHIHFDYYQDGEISHHTISKVDKTGEEWLDIVYWSDEFVWISQEELLTQYVRFSTGVYIYNIDVENAIDEAVKNSCFKEEALDNVYFGETLSLRDAFIETFSKVLELLNIKTDVSESAIEFILSSLDLKSFITVEAEIQELIKIHNLFGNELKKFIHEKQSYISCILDITSDELDEMIAKDIKKEVIVSCLKDKHCVNTKKNYDTLVDFGCKKSDFYSFCSNDDFIHIDKNLQLSTLFKYSKCKKGKFLKLT